MAFGFRNRKDKEDNQVDNRKEIATAEYPVLLSPAEMALIGALANAHHEECDVLIRAGDTRKDTELSLVFSHSITEKMRNSLDPLAEQLFGRSLSEIAEE